MKVSLELLFHYRCDECDRWWSVADIYPTSFQHCVCPHCGAHNQIESIDYCQAPGLFQSQLSNLGQLLVGTGEQLIKQSQEAKSHESTH